MNIQFSASALGTRNLNKGGGPYSLELGVFSPSPAADPLLYYTPGTGNPAVSASDYYLLNGLYGFRSYDLDTMGSEGATIKAREGKRYIWVVSPDHPLGANFQGSSDFKVGYSNDPQIFPSTLTPILRFNTVTTAGGQTQFSCYQAPWLVYNPDAAGDKFWIYAEGLPTSPSRQHELGLFTTADFLTSTQVGVVLPTAAFGGWSSLGRVYRRGAGDWYYLGYSDDSNFKGFAYYTSADGLAWTYDHQITPVNGSFTHVVNGSNLDPTMPCDAVTYQAQSYMMVREQTNGNGAGALSYITLVPIDSGFNMLSSPAAIRLSNSYDDVYPGPYFLQQIGGYQEDGILHIAAGRGFPNSGSQYGLNGGIYTGVSGATGGLWHTLVDRYAFIFDATAAAGAAPCGVKVSCAAGVVTVSWDRPAGDTRVYRIYKGSSAGTQSTLIGETTDNSITDSPTTGQQWWFKVVSLSAGVEQKNRVVHAYVSSQTLMVNNHINRVIDDGGDVTKIDQTWLSAVDVYLTSNDLYRYLLHWADPAFGVKISGGFVTKVYDLGTTRLPRGGDYTPTTSNTFPSTTSNTTYSATGLHSVSPAWVNGANTAHGYFGGGVLNNIQRKTQITVMAVYQKPGTAKATLLATGEFAGMYLVHKSGSPGTVEFGLADNAVASATYKTATAAPTGLATDPHVIGGTFDGSNLIAYADSVAGSTTDASALSNPTLASNGALKGHYASTASNVPFLGSGSQDSKFSYSSQLYGFDSNEALFNAAALIIFEKGLPAAVTAVTTMYQGRM